MTAHGHCGARIAVVPASAAPPTARPQSACAAMRPRSQAYRVHDHDRAACPAYGDIILDVGAYGIRPASQASATSCASVIAAAAGWAVGRSRETNPHGRMPYAPTDDPIRHVVIACFSGKARCLSPLSHTGLLPLSRARERPVGLSAPQSRETNPHGWAAGPRLRAGRPIRMGWGMRASPRITWTTH